MSYVNPEEFEAMDFLYGSSIDGDEGVSSPHLASWSQQSVADVKVSLSASVHRHI